MTLDFIVPNEEHIRIVVYINGELKKDIHNIEYRDMAKYHRGISYVFKGHSEWIYDEHKFHLRATGVPESMIEINGDTLTILRAINERGGD